MSYKIRSTLPLILFIRYYSKDIREIANEEVDYDMQVWILKERNYIVIFIYTILLAYKK